MLYHIAYHPKTNQWMMHSTFTSPSEVEKYIKEHKLEGWKPEAFQLSTDFSQRLRVIIDTTVSRAHNQYLEDQRQLDRDEAHKKLQKSIKEANEEGKVLVRKAVMTKEFIDLHEAELQLKLGALPTLLAKAEELRKSSTADTEQLVQIKLNPVLAEIAGMKDRIKYLMLELKELRPGSAALAKAVAEMAAVAAPETK